MCALRKAPEVLIFSFVHFLIVGVTFFLILKGFRPDWGWGNVIEHLIWFGVGGIFAIIGRNLLVLLGIELCLAVLYLVPRLEARVVIAGFALLNMVYHVPGALIIMKLWGPDYLVALLFPLAEFLWLWRSRNAKRYFSGDLGWVNKFFRRRF